MNTQFKRKLVAKRCTGFDYNVEDDRPYAVVLDVHDTEGYYVEQGTDWRYFATEKEAQDFITLFNNTKIQ